MISNDKIQRILLNLLGLVDLVSLRVKQDWIIYVIRVWLINPKKRTIDGQQMKQYTQEIGGKSKHTTKTEIQPPAVITKKKQWPDIKHATKF